MQNIENKQINDKPIKRTVKHQPIKIVLMAIASGITIFTCYQLINNQINVDGATMVVVACILGLMSTMSLTDRLH